MKSEKYKKPLLKFEIIITVLQIVIITFFCVLQFVPCGALANLPERFDIICIRRYFSIDTNTAGIFLQVDATILTLTIALVALISGFLSDSHMGISYSNYFLSIRPKLYKQIVIIALSLFYFSLGCVCFWLQWNYLVASALFCEILLVLMSAISVYGIFDGKEKIRHEIEMYSISTQLDSTKMMKRRSEFKSDRSPQDGKKSKVDNDKKKKHNKTKDVQDRFIDAFSKILVKDDKGEFEDYLNVFLKITDSVWKCRNSDDASYDWETYRKNCCILLDACADSSEHQSKIFYLKFLESIYDYLFGLIREEKETQKHTSTCRHRFGIVEFYSFCNDIIRKISITEFESSVKLTKLLYQMYVIDLVLFRDYKGEDKNSSNSGENNERWNPDSTISSIQSAMGQYIVEQQSKGNLPNISYWAGVFNIWYGIENVDYLDESDRANLAEAVANGGVSYACGMLNHTQFDIVKKGLYERRLSSLRKFEYYEARTVLAIHGYLYYMAYRENENVVGEELWKMVRAFLEGPDVMQVYREFITQHGVVNDVLIDNLRSEWRYIKADKNEINKATRIPDEKSRLINAMLGGFDLRLGGRGKQTLIMSKVIDDFCLFTILFLSYHSLSDLRWLGDECHRIEDYISYITKENNLEERINGFIEFINADILKNEKSVSDKRKKYEYQANELSEKLQVTIREKYKDKRIREAREKEADYLRNHDIIEEKRIGWKKDIYQYIKNLFGALFHDYLPSSNTNVQFVKVELFNYTTYTDMIDDKFDETDLGRIATRIVDIFIRLLKDKGCVIPKDRKKDFVDDQDYVNYLVGEKLDVMVGSELMLKNTNYRMTESFEDATKNSTWINTFGGFYAAAIKKGSVVLYIRDLEANIREITLDDEYMDITQDEYEYEPILNVSIPFEREELSEYLKNERKRVEVTAQIGIQVYDTNAGIYFESDRRPTV